ncbi:MAG: adenosylcobinamide-GDP ribazoletransferase [Cellvibrionaceae bacterium]|nr:adenosylcobinamide-GDP ribazoletransferase [Cellvibrionaceae bacterium]
MNLKPLFLALALLTRIPLPASVFSKPYSERDYQQSPLYYPLVGFALGLILLGCALLLKPLFYAYLSAAVLLGLWVALSGALHLDGLADCSDAYFAAHQHKNKAQLLAIMQQPQLGAMAVIVLINCLLIKFALLLELMLDNRSLLPLVVICMLSRTAASFYIKRTPYARTAGIAQHLSDGQYLGWLIAISMVCCVLGLWLSSLVFMLLYLPLAVVLLALWRHFWLKKIDGFTGDCVGALIELSEILGLFIAIIAL